MLLTAGVAGLQVKACKWVDQVVVDVPYVMTEEYLNDVVFGVHGCDFVVHGDDPCLTPSGEDVFASAKKMGQFRTIKRTEGVSTTDLLRRMMQTTKDHFSVDDGERSMRRSSDLSDQDLVPPGVTHKSNYLPTSHRITQFSSGRSVQPSDVVVYVDGGNYFTQQSHCMKN